MNKVIITADSSCDMPPALLQKYGIPIIPFYVNFDNESFRDNIDIDRDTLFQRVKETGVLPKTASIAPAEFSAFFAEHLKNSGGIVHISIGSHLSSAFQNATIAATEFDNVFVVDSQALSSAESLIILYAASLAEAGHDAKLIAKEATSYAKRCDISFVLDTLTYMSKSGRCSSITSLGANLLGIKPALSMKDGDLGVGKKYRGKMKMVLPKYIKERLADASVDSTRAFITHTGVDNETMALVMQAVEETGMFKEIIVSEAGCVIASHCGPGTLGILFVRE